MDKNSHNKTTSLSNYAFLTVHILTKGLYSFIVSLVVIVVLSQSVFAGKFKPPRRPDVVPLISHTYDNDRDHDRIDDALLKRAEKALKTKSLAVTPKDRINAQVQIDEMVNVEFIFTDQITQRQIDDFQSSGGEIDYVYKAVSNGWTGRMPLGKVKDIKSKMGDTLVLLEEAKEAVLHMRIATQTGRVRPVWASGFAGSSGYEGDSTITIAIIDTGVDDGHTDLAGRGVYWNDYSSDGEASPRDIYQHGSHVAGIALGSGSSLGTGTTLLYTDSGSLSGVRAGSFYPSVIDIPLVDTSWNSTATWLGGGQATLYHVYTLKGTATWYGINSNKGVSGVFLNTPFTTLSTRAYSTALLSNGRMSTYAVENSMTNYSPVGDGFNTLRGVAPGAQWAGAKVFTNSGSGIMSWTGAAIDDMVANRITYNIKVMNLSLGVIGNPGLDASTRQKINNAAMNGILPVVSAGNDGAGNAGSNEVDDPGRAAMALTVGAANDINELTEYTSSGFLSPGSTAGQEEDYKPDILAPGGSDYYSNIMSVDSNDADGRNASFSDVQNNDYYNIKGTSMASPFAAGTAALLIDALQSTGSLTGGSWDFSSSNDVRLVKMLLCATSTETNTNREAGSGFDPTLQRASNGPDGFPAGKDRYEGYGMLNIDAAIEGGTFIHAIGTAENETLGGSDTARRSWARRVSVIAGQPFDMTLTVPASGDFDLYLYSFTPSPYGTPEIIASSTNSGNGISEAINYTPVSGDDVLLVVKKITGEGQFNLTGNYVMNTLDINKSGLGAGLITSSPGGINCGSDCSEDYLSNTVVTFTDTPDTGSAFAGWSGDDDCSDGVVTMNLNKNCLATFNLLTYILDVTVTGSGTGTVTSSPLGINCGIDCLHDYPYGTVVTLSAEPGNESFFIGWGGDPDCSDGIVTVDAAKTCIATFNSVQYQITTFVNPDGNGSISPDCFAGCWYDSGTIVTLTATGNSGYLFDSWNNCNSSSNNVCTETVNANKSITANFESCQQPVRIEGPPPVYFLTLQSAYNAAEDGDTIQSQAIVFTEDLSINVNKSVTLDGGYNCDFTANPDNSFYNGTTTISDGVLTIGNFIY